MIPALRIPGHHLSAFLQYLSRFAEGAMNAVVICHLSLTQQRLLLAEDHTFHEYLGYCSDGYGSKYSRIPIRVPLSIDFGSVFVSDAYEKATK